MIGGGVNGCGIARDAAGRGLSVMLCEKGDLAGGTSSASTKLIHGGLRYLEYYEFRLVREALTEREVLLAMAPHIVRPMRFVLPHHEGLRSALLIRLGLFLYDHLGGRRLLPPSRSLDLARHDAGKSLKGDYKRGFEYSDCWVEDARLVVLNAMDAASRGASIRVGTEVVGLERLDGLWRVEIEDRATGAREQIRARAVINAAGPWIAETPGSQGQRRNNSPVRLVKGSHIVVKRLFAHDKAYIFQNSDNRIIFAIPFERDYTLIGTTDVDFNGSPDKVEISQAEIDYLCSAASEYFRAPVDPETIAWTYSGVRPLYDDGETAAHEATRDYVLELDNGDGGAPQLTIVGGKITTYRRLAEAALEKLAPHFPQAGRPWTKSAALPGGDFPVSGLDEQVRALSAACPALTPDHAARLTRAYGTRAKLIVDGVAGAADLGEHFGADLYQREVDYLMRHEWARTADDILWRRSKLGLRLSESEAKRLADWMVQHGKDRKASAA